MDEHAMVLKHLGLQVAGQGVLLLQATVQQAALMDDVAPMRAAGDRLMMLLGVEVAAPTQDVAAPMTAPPDGGSRAAAGPRSAVKPRRRSQRRASTLPAFGFLRRSMRRTASTSRAR